MSRSRFYVSYDDCCYVLAVHEIREPSEKHKRIRIALTILYQIRVANCVVEHIYIVRKQLRMLSDDMRHALIGQLNIRIQIRAWKFHYLPLHPPKPVKVV